QKRRGLFLADRITEILLVLMAAHDDGLRQHASEVGRLSESVAGRLGLGVAERTLVRRTAELHDIGKLGVDRRVLDKPKPADEARAELETYAGSQFDRAVVSALVAELFDRDPVAEELAAPPSGDGSLRRPARLHALLESASMVEDPDHLSEALDAVAQVVG